MEKSLICKECIICLEEVYPENNNFMPYVNIYNDIINREYLITISLLIPLFLLISSRGKNKNNENINLGNRNYLSGVILAILVVLINVSALLFKDDIKAEEIKSNMPSVKKSHKVPKEHLKIINLINKRIFNG